MLKHIKSFLTQHRRDKINVVLVAFAIIVTTAVVHVLDFMPSPLHNHGHVDISDVFGVILSDIVVILSLLGLHTAVVHFRDKRAAARIAASNDIVAAILDDHLEIVLQPVYRVSTGAIVGFESLVRMNHPQHGIVHPERMMAIISDADPTVARRLTAFVANKTASYYDILSADGHDFQMSINLHRHDLMDATIIPTLINALLNNNMPHDRLTAEISNDIISHDIDMSLRVLAGIESAEIKLSIDDFGTETSPFLHFRDFLVDEVKIDNVITHRIDINQHNMETVRAIVHTAHSTGTYVTAKCIETPAELNKVKEAGCDFVQGYIIAPPMTIDQARVWLKTQRTRPS